MAVKSQFKITQFTNPSGQKVWRVSGSLHGKQVRRNFKTRSEATAERDRLEIQRINGSNHGRHMWVKISHEEHDDAFTALSLLKKAESRKSLTDAVQFFLGNHQEPDLEISTQSAVEEYLGLREGDSLNGTITTRQLYSIRSELKRFSSLFREKPISFIAIPEIDEFLSAGNVSLKTQNNRRAYLLTFFSFCLDKNYVALNPIEKVKRHKVKQARGSATTLTDKQASDLMKFLEDYPGHQFKNGEFAGGPGCLVLFFALCLFAGVRPDWKDGEISKIQAKDINLSTDTIHIEPDVSKTNEKRSITIQPNLKIWLRKYPLENYPIMPFPNVERSLIQLRKQFALAHDVLRHTFISMLVGKFRSVGDAALQAGNSENIVRKHYLNLKSKEEANRFWKIVPKKI